MVGGYFYFDRKFSPAANTLTVSGEVTDVPFNWVSEPDNPRAALLVPVGLKGVNETLYMQLDFGAPSTVFYGKSLQSLAKKYPTLAKPGADGKKIDTSYALGALNVASSGFAVRNYGNPVEFDDTNVANIIGTIGTDILEKRVIVLDLKRDVVSFVLSAPEEGMSSFAFKKRRILIPSEISGEKLDLLYDSGSSAYELITTPEEWQRLRIPNGAIKTDKGNSWGNELKVISAPAEQTVRIANATLPLKQVTYVDGKSKMQTMLMASSGMKGMIGNQLFVGHVLTIDAANQRMKID